MGDRLLEIVKQIGIFMVCAQMILHFKPSDKYKKYIKLLISFMVLVQLVLPVMALLDKNGKSEFEGRVLFYDDLIAGSMADVNLTSMEAEQLLEKMTMEEVKTRINNNENMANDADMEKQESVQTQDEIQIERIEVSADD